MYFPYLRGRQFELIALRELVENDLIGNQVVPVIEPIKLTSTFVKTLSLYTVKEHPHALVMNPEVGDFLSKLKEKKEERDIVVELLSSELKSPYLIMAYLMQRNTAKLLERHKDLDQLMIVNVKRDCLEEYLKTYDGHEPKYALIPEGPTFARKAPKSKVMFGDKFSKAARNADYSKEEDQFFTEDHLYFAEEGYQGFADYSVVGSEYNESGFAPLAVAIHIVYFAENRTLRIHHFVSDSNVDINDPAGKFGEALQKLVDWLQKNEVPKTLGLKGFLDCYETGKYPGLGTVKKYSIMHHLELMNMYLEGEL